jgi:hypothetical protein
LRLVPAANLKNGRFTPLEKPILVKAVFLVAAGGGVCTVARVRQRLGRIQRRKEIAIELPA